MAHENNNCGLDRREFLAKVSAGAVAAGLAGAGARAGWPGSAELEKRNEQPGMVYVPFGQTNLNVSRLSYGCIRLTADGLGALEEAVERGVNLVHVSSSYTRGQAIQVLGKFLQKPGNRDKVWIMLKGEQNRGLPASIDDHLKTLNTDHVDIICAPLNNAGRIREGAREVETFEALKKAGKLRFLNLTTHGSVQESMEAALDAGAYTTLLAAVNPGTIGAMQKTIQRAKEKNVGVMAMKSRQNRGGAGPDEIASALLPAGVTTILKTLNTRDEVDAWFAAVNKAAKETASAPSDCQVAVASGMCTLCGLCEGCPNGVAIQDIVRDYTYYYKQQGLRQIAAAHYAELPASAMSRSCQDCGRCEELCPMRVPVRRLLREAHARLSATA